MTPAPTPILMPVVIPAAEDAFRALDVDKVVGDSIKVLNAEPDVHLSELHEHTWLTDRCRRN
jgi:hypothetical protein